MKTTLELPDDLVKEIKLRAVHRGTKLEDLVADLLRQGLRASTTAAARLPAVDKATVARRKALTRKFVSGRVGRRARQGPLTAVAGANGLVQGNDT